MLFNEISFLKVQDACDEVFRAERKEGTLRHVQRHVGRQLGAGPYVRILGSHYILKG